jgi:hypothetical protein
MIPKANFAYWRIHPREEGIFKHMRKCFIACCNAENVNILPLMGFAIQSITDPFVNVDQSCLSSSEEKNL